jgi:hypothetical protein
VSLVAGKSKTLLLELENIFEVAFFGVMMMVVGCGVVW